MIGVYPNEVMNKDLIRKLLVIVGVILIAAGCAGSFVYFSQPKEVVEELEVWTPGEAKHPVYINDPKGIAVVDSGKRAQDGSIIAVRCNTCHTNKEANHNTKSGDELVDFHQKMPFKHGSLSCVSCHNPENYETLHLADKTKLDFKDTMQLCAQCHGKKFRDYNNGSHGGMTGYWDLQRGSRQRNTCTDCHSPHVPAYPTVMPVFPPKVRQGSKLSDRSH